MPLDTSQEHGNSNSHSGLSTPFNKSGTQTPRADDAATAASSSPSISTTENAEILSEKLNRRKSFGTAALATAPLARASSSGLSHEHSEQGQVKKTVYLQYLKAASRVGFSAFLFTSLLQQAVSVLANITLRNLGEHNRESGDNSGMFNYLLGYGLFSLASIILGGISAVLLWVLCTIKSSRYLHDSVSRFALFLDSCS
jgi:ATP-binding cassette, subfamily C (CFTR/MRP), member 1